MSPKKIFFDILLVYNFHFNLFSIQSNQLNYISLLILGSINNFKNYITKIYFKMMMF
jgi:hypothetical protein